MIGAIIGIAIGIGAIILGAKGFKPEGLPFTNSKRITGTPAKIVGVICIPDWVGLHCWKRVSVRARELSASARSAP